MELVHVSCLVKEQIRGHLNVRLPVLNGAVSLRWSGSDGRAAASPSSASCRARKVKWRKSVLGRFITNRSARANVIPRGIFGLPVRPGSRLFTPNTPRKNNMTTGLALADSYHKRTKLADKEATSFAATASSSPAHATACARANRGRNGVDMTALETTSPSASCGKNCIYNSGLGRR